MNSHEAESKYHDLGLEIRRITDEPGEVYEPHRHAGVYIYTLGGSARVKLDDSEWQNIETGQELHIEDQQLHEAVAGPEGWEYLLRQALKK